MGSTIHSTPLVPETSRPSSPTNVWASGQEALADQLLAGTVDLGDVVGRARLRRGDVDAARWTAPGHEVRGLASDLAGQGEQLLAHGTVGSGERRLMQQSMAQT